MSDLRKKYFYSVTCPVCEQVREVQNRTATRCKSCAGKQTYVKPSSERNDKRLKGDGYITKQGYHLIFDGGRYKPAHRVIMGVDDPSLVVHHIDGDKLNNEKSNLMVCTKEEHREFHGQLERVSYFLVQSGFIVFEDGRYKLSTPAKKFVGENSVNSGKPLTVDAEGNPEPSPFWGRCNDYPEREYTQVSGSAEDPTDKEGYDIVSSLGKLRAARRAGPQVTRGSEG